MQGWRTAQEDSHITSTIKQRDGKEGMLFCVFDGHGGKEVSKYAEEEFEKVFTSTQEFKEGKYAEALVLTLKTVDEQISTAFGESGMSIE
jgi:protein phosphatase 2C family protein 2/3